MAPLTQCWHWDYSSDIATWSSVNMGHNHNPRVKCSTVTVIALMKPISVDDDLAQHIRISVWSCQWSAGNYILTLVISRFIKVQHFLWEMILTCWPQLLDQLYRGLVLVSWPRSLFQSRLEFLFFLQPQPRNMKSWQARLSLLKYSSFVFQTFYFSPW